MFDDVIIPEHNMVSSEWEKNEIIRSAYDRARALIIPVLIDLMEKCVGDSVWIASTDLFLARPRSELWTKSEYVADHGANDESDANGTNIQGTSTQLFLGTQRGQMDDIISANGKKKLPKGFPDKCLLRHEFSEGIHWFMVCKLRRRHQKEIVKLPSLSSQLSSKPPSSSAVLDALTRSAVLKHDNQPFKSTRGNFGATQHNDKSKSNESGSDAIETSAKDQPPKLEVLQKEANEIITDALSIVRAAENIEIGEVPKTNVVRWKAESEFEIRYFK